MTSGGAVGQEDEPNDSSNGRDNSAVNLPQSASISDLSAHSDKHTNNKIINPNLIGEKRNFQSIKRSANKISFKIS